MALADSIQKLGYSMTWLFGILTAIITLIAARYESIGISTDQLYGSLIPAGFATLILTLLGIAIWISGKEVDANGL